MDKIDRPGHARGTTRIEYGLLICVVLLLGVALGVFIGPALWQLLPGFVHTLLGR